MLLQQILQTTALSLETVLAALKQLELSFKTDIGTHFRPFAFAELESLVKGHFL